MRTEQDYRQQKMAELQFLRAQVGDCRSLSAPREAFTHWVVKSKYALRTRLLTGNLAGLESLSETNFNNQEELYVGNFQLTSRYQRYDLRAMLQNPLSEIYRITQSKFRSSGQFTASGMSAISALLTALNSSSRRQDIGILIDPRSYFETICTLQKFFPDIPLFFSAEQVTTPEVLLWADSICPTGHGDLGHHPLLSRIRAVVADTTCWELADGKLHGILESMHPLNLPAILVRSHIKLDSLALEFGRLGSVVFLYHNSLPKGTLSWLGEIAPTTAEACARLGLNFTAQNLLPFHHNEDFHVLNRIRVQAIRENTRHLAAQLKTLLSPSSTTVQSYDHQLFFTIDLGQTERTYINNLGERLAAACREQGLFARFAGSFGFDFHAVDAYLDYVSRHILLRISPSDAPEPEIVRLGNVIAHFLEALR